MKTPIKNLVGMLLIACVGGFAGATLYKNTEKTTSIGTDAPDRRGIARFANLSNAPEATVDFTKAAEQSIHAVVHVKTYYPQSNNNYGIYDPFQDFFWGNGNRQQQEPQQPEASGSGVIISNDGYIVTNNHVVEKASKVEITLNDKRTYTASVIGTDPSTDLALIKIDEKELPYLSYGNSDILKVGEWVLAVGNPFNLTSTVTAGIVSAKARNINILNSKYPIEAFIQTDAAVNLQDAIAILKMIVGLDVNGAGKALSPYQAMAADYDGNGSVQLSDAIGVLKHVVGLPGATPQWVFFDEADTGIPGKATLNPGAVPGVTADLPGVAAQIHVGLVGVLRGDVDGSYAGAPGSQDLDVVQPTYIADLARDHGLQLSQFGVYP